MGQVVTSGDTDGKPTDPPPPSASPGPAGPSPRPPAQAPTTRDTGPQRHRSDPSAQAPTTAAPARQRVRRLDRDPSGCRTRPTIGAPARRRVRRLPVEFALSEFVPDAGAELDPKGRGVNRHRVDFDAQEAQSLYRPLHPDLIVARV